MKKRGNQNGNTKVNRHDEAQDRRENQESRGGGDVHGRLPCGEALEVREAGLHLQQDGEEAHRVGRDQQGQWVDQERLRPGRHGLRGEGMDKGIQRDTEDHKGR